jgi:hypothetical protein
MPMQRGSQEFNTNQLEVSNWSRAAQALMNRLRHSRAQQHSSTFLSTSRCSKAGKKFRDTYLALRLLSTFLAGNLSAQLSAVCPVFQWRQSAPQAQLDTRSARPAFETTSIVTMRDGGLE